MPLVFNCSTCCREFLEHEKGKQSPETTLKDVDTNMLINKHFADWLEQNVKFMVLLYNGLT